MSTILETTTNFVEKTRLTRRQEAGILPAGTKVLKGAMCALVGGKVYSWDSGMNTATLPTKFTSLPGADANGGLVLYALQQNVAYQELGGASKTLSVNVVYTATKTNVIVQLGTDAGSLVTSTAQDVVDAIGRHGIASRLLRLGATGTGLGLRVVTALTDITQVILLGVAQSTYDNSDGLTDAAVDMKFDYGVLELLSYPSSPISKAMVGGYGSLYDNVSVSSAISSLSYLVRIEDYRNGFAFINTEANRI